MKKWDLDNSGRIDLTEFRRACAVLGVAATVPEIDAAFKLLDDDGSGTLAYEEINKFLRVGSSGRKASSSARKGMEEVPPKPILLSQTLLGHKDAHLARTQATRIRATTSAADLFHKSHAAWEEEERKEVWGARARPRRVPKRTSAHQSGSAARAPDGAAAPRGSRPSRCSPTARGTTPPPPPAAGRRPRARAASPSGRCGPRQS